MVTNSFSHLDTTGRATMVDVSGKPVTRRVARASCFVHLQRATVEQLEQLPKGDAVAVARIAGIQAAKRCADWVPLAHPLPLEQIAVSLTPALDEQGPTGVRIESAVVVTAKTGAEMEALVACSAAALALYDMVKAIERDAEITELRLEHKSGGRSGDYHRERSSSPPEAEAGAPQQAKKP